MSARERFQKLKELKVKKNQIIIQNKKDLINEYKRNRIGKNQKTVPNKNYINNLNIQKLKSEKELIELNLSGNVKEKKEYEKRKQFNYSIEDHESWSNNQSVKQENISNSSKLQNYNQLALQTYLKDVQKISKTDINDKYITENEAKQPAMLDNLSKNLVREDKRKMGIKKKQLEREDDSNFSTYINRKNKEFNQKLARDYAPFTKQTKDNFERGTAL